LYARESKQQMNICLRLVESTRQLDPCQLATRVEWLYSHRANGMLYASPRKA